MGWGGLVVLVACRFGLIMVEWREGNGKMAGAMNSSPKLLYKCELRNKSQGPRVYSHWIGSIGTHKYVNENYGL